MTVVASSASFLGYNLFLPLPRYAQMIGMAECAFFGVSSPYDKKYACSPVWTKVQRDMVEHALREAEEELVNEVGYPLKPRWIFENYGDEQPFALYPIAKYAWVLEGGIRGTSDIALSEAVSHVSDPAIIGPVATTVTDEDEIRVYHPGLEVEINPSKITLAGGFVTIEIPRCRLVAEDYIDNPPEGLDYMDVPPSPTSPFLAEVDIKRVYNDPSKQVEFVYKGGSANCSVGNACEETIEEGCIHVHDQETGILHVHPASWIGGEWVSSSSCTWGRGCPHLIRMYYRAGMPPGNPWSMRQMETTVLRLAHSKMPDEPCGCEISQRLWKRDRNIPDIMTRERLNCPFGLSDGAWVAWQFALSMRVVRSRFHM